MINFKSVKQIVIAGRIVEQIKDGTNVLWQASDLPSAYQEVEYIKAAAGVEAYINLGFVFDTAAVIYLTQTVDDIRVTSYPFGAAETSAAGVSTGLRCMLSNPYDSNACLYGSDKGSFVIAKIDICTEATEYKMEMSDGILRITDLTHDNTSETNTNQVAYTMTNELYLLAQNYSGRPRFGGTRQIHRFKYFDKNNELICDMIPCYRKTDGEIGMYDIVRKGFFANVGTGTFEKGPNV